MLIDNRTREMWRSIPRDYAQDYPCRLFSQSIAGEFLTYLKGVEEEADPLILALVGKVYGADFTAGRYLAQRAV